MKQTIATNAKAVNVSNESRTPGPWKASCRDMSYVDGDEWSRDEFLQWEVEGPDVPRGRGDYYQADALLIAAAPDMLDALEQMLRLWRALGGTEDAYEAELARAALAKAGVSC